MKKADICFIFYSFFGCIKNASLLGFPFCAWAFSLSLSLDCIFRISPCNGGSCSPSYILQDLTEQQKKSIAQHLEEAVEKAIEKDISASVGQDIRYLLVYCDIIYTLTYKHQGQYIISTIKCIFRSFDVCIQAWNISNLASRSC